MSEENVGISPMPTARIFALALGLLLASAAFAACGAPDSISYQRELTAEEAATIFGNEDSEDSNLFNLGEPADSEEAAMAEDSEQGAGMDAPTVEPEPTAPSTVFVEPTAIPEREVPGGISISLPPGPYAPGTVVGVETDGLPEARTAELCSTRVDQAGITREDCWPHELTGLEAQRGSYSLILDPWVWDAETQRRIFCEPCELVISSRDTSARVPVQFTGSDQPPPALVVSSEPLGEDTVVVWVSLENMPWAPTEQFLVEACWTRGGCRDVGMETRVELDVAAFNECGDAQNCSFTVYDSTRNWWGAISFDAETTGF